MTTFPAATASVAATIGPTIGTGAFNGYAAAADERWIVTADPLNLAPGAYTLSAIRARLSRTETADCTEAYFVIWSVSGGNWTEVVTVDVSAGVQNSFASYTLSAALSGTLTVTAGQTLYYGVMLHANNGHTANQPIIGRTAGGPATSYRWSVAGAARPTALTTAGAALSDQYSAITNLDLTCTHHILYSGAYSGATSIMIPRITTDIPWYIIARGAVVADGQALTVKFGNCTAASPSYGAEYTETSVLDMGDTDQMTAAATNVALAGAGAEAGDTFDLAWCIKTNGTKFDLLYQNRTTGQGPGGAATDYATISHYVKNAAARPATPGTDGYTAAPPRFLELSGTATVTRITIGWEPLLILGDSQATATSSSRIGYHLLAEGTDERDYWVGYISGDAILSDGGGVTSLPTRFRAATPGQGDLCEMPGVVVVFAGMGINDLSQSTNYAVGRQLVTQCAWKVSEIMYYAALAGNRALIIGLPPFSSGGGSATEYDALSVQMWNGALHGIANAARAAWYNPWPAMVQAGTQADAVPTFTAAYTEDAGQHYNATGAQIVGAAAITQFEAATVARVGWIDELLESGTVATTTAGNAANAATITAAALDTDGSNTDVALGASTATIQSAALHAAAMAAQLATDKGAVIAAKADIRKDVSILGTTGADRGTLDVDADNWLQVGGGVALR